MILVNFFEVMTSSRKRFHPVSCTVETVFLYYFSMTTLFWMLLEGVHLYLQVVVVFVIKKRVENPANIFAFGWLTPLFITITQSSIFASRYGETEICWLSPYDGSIWAFAGPALVILIANLILLWAFFKSAIHRIMPSLAQYNTHSI